MTPARIFLGPALLAAAAGATLIGAAQAEEPSSTEITAAITELASVRDYEHLRWVLNAIESCEPQQRAALLQALDDRVQALIRAEVEVRVASAITSVSSVLPGLGAPSDFAAAPSEHLTPSAATGEPLVEALAASHSATAQEINQAIEESRFSGDGLAWIKEQEKIAAMIKTIADPTQRQAFEEQASAQRVRLLREYATAKQNDISQRLHDSNEKGKKDQ